MRLREDVQVSTATYANNTRSAPDQPVLPPEEVVGPGGLTAPIKSFNRSEHAATVIGVTEERYLLRAYEDTLRQREMQAAYPELLFGDLAPKARPIYECVRPASGRIVRVLQQDTLRPDQRQRLAQFRFRQYLLWHWYDKKTIVTEHIQTDPALATLPSDTLHAFVGTNDGRILAYFTVQPASTPTPENTLQRLMRRVWPFYHRLGEVQRPLFPSEFESFGPTVFASLPDLRQTPVHRIRELNCLLRNNVFPFASTALAVVETAYTICQVLLLPQLQLRALVGCIDLEARKLLAALGMPMLYAVEAPVINNNLPYYWSADMNDDGKFWPFVVSANDFLAQPDHLVRLNALLALPSRETRRALARFRQESSRIIPKALHPSAHSSPFFWADDAVYTGVPNALPAYPAQN